MSAREQLLNVARHRAEEVEAAVNLPPARAGHTTVVVNWVTGKKQRPAL